MTHPVTAEDAPDQRTGVDEALDPAPRQRPTLIARDAVAATCPYLTSADGSWRMAAPSRDHRCAALEPPAPQTTDKQRRHCLTADHAECAIFRAARTARSTALAGGSDPGLIDAADRRRRPLARTAPILLEPARLIDGAVRIPFERAPGQLALVALMVLAFAIVAFARLSAGSGSAGSAAPVGSAFAAASHAPTAVPTLTAAATPGPSASPSSSPVPSFRTTYKVKKGDTLLAIAHHFGTTAAKIKTLNGMTSSILKIGQVLKIP
jgi:LysM repeat protein